MRKARRVNVQLSGSVERQSPSLSRSSSSRRPRRHWLSLLLLTTVSIGLNTALLLHNRITRLGLPDDVVLPPRALVSIWRTLAAQLGIAPLRSQAAEALLELVREPPPSGRLRTFRVQRSRADYRVTVTDALRELGLRQTNESWEFDIFWGNQWAELATYMDHRLQRHMLISSILGLMAESIGDKDFLGFGLQHCAAQHGEDVCDFVPPIYTMPMQAALWRNAFAHHRYWIRKDKKIWGSQGVAIISSKKDLPADTSYQLQKYISQPLLWRGFKHDIRLWAVITSVSPLRIYLLQDGWARVAARPYDADGLDTNVGDACMHLTANYCPDLPQDSLRLLRVNSKRFRDGLSTPRSFEGEPNPNGAPLAAHHSARSTPPRAAHCSLLTARCSPLAVQSSPTASHHTASHHTAFHHILRCLTIPHLTASPPRPYRVPPRSRHRRAVARHRASRPQDSVTRLAVTRRLRLAAYLQRRRLPPLRLPLV